MSEKVKDQDKAKEETKVKKEKIKDKSKELKKQFEEEKKKWKEEKEQLQTKVKKLSTYISNLETEQDKLVLRLEMAESVKFGIPDPFFVVDKEMKVTYMNDACAEATGYSKNEVINKMHCMDVFNSDICNTACAIKECMKSGDIITGKRVTMKNRNGKEIPLSVSAAPMKTATGQILGGFEIARDITKDLEIQQQIHDQLELTDSLKRGIADPFFMVDPDLKITFMNQACADATGYSVEETVGKLTCREIFKSDICDNNCAIKHCISTGATITDTKVHITNRSGKVIPIIASAGALKDSTGKILGGFEIARDITAEVEMDKSISQTVDGTAVAIEETNTTTQHLVSAINQQSSAINQTASTTKEFNETINQSAEMAKNVVNIGEESVILAQEGQGLISKNINEMNEIQSQVETISENILELSDHSQQIGLITMSVKDISDQTKLLALNAAIEATHAGDHGKGFAVVAAQVRELALQSREATEKISKLISDMQRSTNSCVRVADEGTKSVKQGVELINSAGHFFEKIVNNVKKSAESAKQISAAMGQQTIGVNQITQSIEEINTGLKQSLSGAHQTQKAMEDINIAIATLKETTDKDKH